jgi:3-oxoacyl-[acyl-carrier protein] reductase
MNKKLKNKYAVVTGGARGVGKFIVQKLIEDGASVVICSRTEKDLEATCQELDPERKVLFGVKADISIIEDCNRVIDHASKLFGTVDILINNAAIYGPIGLLETNSSSEWKKTIEVNFLGTVFCTQYVIPIMKRNKKGKIISIVGGGVGGINPISRFSAYVSSKTAIAGFTEVLAKELQDWNIQVNCVSPGAIKTKLIEYLLVQGRTKAGNEMYDQAIGSKQIGVVDPHRIADMVAYMASDESDHLTGKILSAKRETIAQLTKIKTTQSNLYTLRRIDNDLFCEKK